jgi:DNA-binding CsgD family transcriptional regulator
MISKLLRVTKIERRALVLAVIICIQSLCGLFFLGDVIADFFSDEHMDTVHLVTETVAAFALIAGVIYLMIELRQLLARFDQMETGLRVARGEVVEIIETHFSQWRLSPAERDVALLLLKGVDNESIAALRGTAKGTVRAQSAAIYTKAGVDGRAQLISLFLEELLMDGNASTS